MYQAQWNISTPPISNVLSISCIIKEYPLDILEILLYSKSTPLSPDDCPTSAGDIKNLLLPFISSPRLVHNHYSQCQYQCNLLKDPSFHFLPL
jgi:hypothetical protein